MKLRFTLLLVIVCSMILVMWLPGWVVRSCVPSFIESKTGYTLTLGSVHVNLMAGKVALRDVRLQNSKEFPIADFVDCKELSVSLSPWSLIQRPIRIQSVVVDVQSVAFVQDASSRSNIETFTQRLQGEAKDDSKQGSSKESKTEFVIERCTLRLGRITALVTQDSGQAPLRVDSNWGLDREYTQITQDNIARTFAPLSAEVAAKGLELFAKLAAKKITSGLQNVTQGQLGDALKGVGSKAVDAAKAVTSLFGGE